jgi:hypothetical protein
MKWVSVKERLPDTNEWVLVKIHDGYVSFGRYWGDNDWSNCHVFVTNDDNMMNEPKGIEILWWMRIPE